MINTAPNKIELLDFGKSSTASNQFVTDPDVLVDFIYFVQLRIAKVKTKTRCA